MNKKCTLSIICTFLFNLSALCSGNEDSTALFKKIFDTPAYKAWSAYWGRNLVDVNFDDLQFTGVRKEAIKFQEIKKTDYFSNRMTREFTLIYSPYKNFVFDPFDDKTFTIENDSLKYLGGDIDPSISIFRVHDSLYYYHTHGTTSFFNESVWLTDSICVAFGFTFSPNSIEEESDLYVILELFNLQQKNTIVYLSRRFSLVPNQSRLNSTAFLKHKFPDKLK